MLAVIALKSRNFLRDISSLHLSIARRPSSVALSSLRDLPALAAIITACLVLARQQFGISEDYGNHERELSV